MKEEIKNYINQKLDELLLNFDKYSELKANEIFDSKIEPVLFPNKSYNLFTEIKNENSNLLLKQNGEIVKYENASINPDFLANSLKSLKESLHKDMNKYEQNISELFNAESSIKEIFDSSDETNSIFESILSNLGTFELYCKYNLNFSLGKAEVLEQPLQSISKSIGERLIDKPFHRSEREDTSNKERKEEREETRADTIQPLFGKDDFNNRPSYKEKYMSREETKGRIFESSEEESSEFVGRLDQNKVKNKVDSQFLSDVSTHKIGFLKVEWEDRNCYFKRFNVSADRVAGYIRGDQICVNDKVILFGYLQNYQIDNSIIEFELIDANGFVHTLKIPSLVDKSVQAFSYCSETFFLLSGGTNEDNKLMSPDNSIVTWNLKELKEAAKFNDARSHHSTVQFDKFLYAFGGLIYCQGEHIPVRSIERIEISKLFDKESFWDCIETVNQKFDFCCIKSVAIPFEKRILIFGGIKSNLRSYTKYGYAFDTSENIITIDYTSNDSVEKQIVKINHSCKILCPSIIIENQKPAVSSSSLILRL